MKEEEDRSFVKGALVIFFALILCLAGGFVCGVYAERHRPQARLPDFGPEPSPASLQFQINNLQQQLCTLSNQVHLVVTNLASQWEQDAADLERQAALTHHARK